MGTICIHLLQLPWFFQSGGGSGGHGLNLIKHNFNGKIQNNFDTDPRLRISPGEGRELVVVLEFPRGNTEIRYGEKRYRNSILARKKKYLPRILFRKI